MILVIGGLKGGTGKTTIATNIVVMRSNEKRKVLFIDADEQEGAWDWCYHRQGLDLPIDWAMMRLSGKDLHKKIKEFKDEYDDIIIDVGGRDTTSQRACLISADIFLIPFRPRVHDLWTLDKVEIMIKSIRTANPKLKCFAFINQADHKGKNNSDVLEILSKSKALNEVIETYICQRIAYHNAYAEGLAIIETEKKDKKAMEEIKDLYDWISYHSMR